jgi:glycosyltransferase involved in cell wall biosynthesis
VRVLLDVRHRTTRSGAVSYIDNLTPRLLRSESAHEFVLLRNEGQPFPGGLAHDSMELPLRSAVAQAVHDQVLLPRLLRRTGVDIYHPLKYLGTMFPTCAQVTTAHAITEDYHGAFPGSCSEVVYWRYMGRRILRASAAVIAVSGFIRDFLVERIGVDPGRITVVPNGIDPRFTRLPGSASAGTDPGGRTAAGSGTVEGPETAPYLLMVGNVFPVKNHRAAVDAFAGVAAEFPLLRLKLAGATHHPYCSDVRAAAERAGIADRVDFLGYVEPSSLVPLMNDAMILLMPSLTEGCPVTLLEAMACGTPVIASGRGGIPETARDAAFIVDDPFDSSGWMGALRDLLRSKDRRGRLSAAGQERARAFTWERTAASTLQVYDALEALAS